MGTVAGFPNVTVEMDMQLQLDGSFEATYTMGANGELPGGNPGVYEMDGQFDISGLATPSPSPTASPTDEPVEGLETVWGNNNCSGANHMAQPDPVDSLFVLRGDAGLSADTGDCPGMGADIEVVNASPHTWGDVDCTNGMNPVDSLKVLRFDAGLDAAQAEGCPLLGSEVTIVEA
jgi:hypothetical protein